MKNSTKNAQKDFLHKFGLYLDLESIRTPVNYFFLLPKHSFLKRCHPMTNFVQPKTLKFKSLYNHIMKFLPNSFCKISEILSTFKKHVFF